MLQNAKMASLKDKLAAVPAPSGDVKAEETPAEEVSKEVSEKKKVGKKLGGKKK